MGQLNDNVVMDLFYARDVTGTNYTLLGAIDEATNLHQVRILKDKNPDTVLEAFRQMWVRPYGVPHKVTMDKDGCFQGEMWEYLARAGVETDYVPPEAHHKLGKAERNNAVFREVLNRTADAMAITDQDGMEEAVDSCIHAVNSIPRTRGMSPYACVFGQVPRIPGELLSDEHGLAVDVDQQQHRLRSIVFRAEAQKALADVNVDTHVRRAILRKTAHMKVDDITPGAKVAVWRSQLRGKSTKKRGGYVIGRLITWDGSCAWVQIGWQTVKVDRAQMRPAYGFESWTPSDEDIAALRQAEDNFLQGEVEDGRDEAPPDDEPFVPEISNYEQNVQPEPVLDMYRLPEAVAGAQRSAQGSEYGPSRRPSKATSTGTSPYPVSKEAIPREEQASGSDARRSSKASTSRSETDQRSQIKRPPLDSLPEDSQETKRIALPDKTEVADIPEASAIVPDTTEVGEQIAEAMMCWEEISPGVYGLSEPGQDGSFAHPRQGRDRLVNLPEVFASEHASPGLEEDDELELCHSDWHICYAAEQASLVNPDNLTRKEQKALDREIPWREIYSRGGDYLEQFVQAAQKEHQSWMDWAPVVPLTESEAREILRDPQRKKRVMKTRSCYRDKNVGRLPLKAKARVVVLGHRDPDLAVISRDSPTPSRLSEMLLLSIYISGCNQRFNRTSKSWILKAADASTAFLQGKQPESERPDDLYMTPPTDGIVEMLKGNAWNAPLYRITGNVYGLANAPRLWAQEVSTKLLAANFKTHTLDRMLFKHHNDQHELDCLALVYVDDFLVCYREDYDVEQLHRMFQWGEWTDAKTGIKFKGKEIKAEQEQSGEWILSLTQKEFIKGLQPGRISRSRAQQDPKLSLEETTEFRSCSGSIQWLAGQTRPDVAAGVSLANKGTETTIIEDLKGLYKLMAYLKATDESGIVLRGLPLNDETLILSYGDCSWANAQGLKSQEGIVVVLTTPSSLDGHGPCMMVDWKTTRTPRVVRSTIAGEAYAADDAIDRASLANAMLTEIITGDPILKTGPLLKHAHATDCRSLYDAVISANPNTEEKRVLLTVRAIQEAIDVKLFRWVPTGYMVADVLTKESEQLRWAFLPWMKNQVCYLKEPD